MSLGDDVVGDDVMATATTGVFWCNLKGSALPADPKIQKNAKVNHQQLIIFSGVELILILKTESSYRFSSDESLLHHITSF